MERRELLKAGALLPFVFPQLPKTSTAEQKPLKDYYSPFFKSLGKAKSVTLNQEYEYATHELTRIGPYSRYVDFPIEVRITVEYEHGEEEWGGFNMTNEKVERFVGHDFLDFVDRFFKSECTAYSHGLQLAVKSAQPIPGFTYDGVPLKLCSITKY